MIKKALRTILVYFPFLEGLRLSYRISVQRIFNIPFEDCFRAIKFFPEIKNAQYLDIGGNVGLGVEAVLMYNKSCVVHSFEPNPETFNVLRKLLKGNGRVKLYNFGLGSKEGELELFVPVYKGYIFSGLASFDPGSAKSWLGRGNLFFYNEKYLEIKKLICRVKRLDDLGLDPFFIKLDVEGFEYQVLRGGEETIKKSKPIILIETIDSNDEKIRFLKPLGYKPYRFDKGGFKLCENGGFNTFLIPDEKVSLVCNHAIN